MSEAPQADLAEQQVPPDRDWRDSFDDFYVAELPRLVALARGLAGAAIAEDLAQEGMLVAYQHGSRTTAR